MAPPVTEVATIPMKPGVNLDDPSTPEGTIWQETITTVLSQPGANKCYWGRVKESPNIVLLFLDWKTLDAHHQFMKQPVYKPFVDNLMSITDGDLTLYHVPFTPNPPTTALSSNTSPVTEIMTAYFTSGLSDSNKSSADDVIKKLVTLIESHAEGYTGSAGGWMVEQDVPIPGESDKKGPAYVLAIGWTSVDAHMAFRETSHFKDNIGSLRDMTGLAKLAMVHYSGMLIDGEVGAEERGAIGESGAPDAQEEILNPHGGAKVPPKTAADGTTTKNNDDLKGAANSLKKDRAGRGNNEFGK